MQWNCQHTEFLIVGGPFPYSEKKKEREKERRGKGMITSFPFEAANLSKSSLSLLQCKKAYWLLNSHGEPYSV
jgi:hypothetical protein